MKEIPCVIYGVILPFLIDPSPLMQVNKHWNAVGKADYTKRILQGYFQPPRFTFHEFIRHNTALSGLVVDPQTNFVYYSNGDRIVRYDRDLHSYSFFSNLFQTSKLWSLTSDAKVKYLFVLREDSQRNRHVCVVSLSRRVVIWNWKVESSTYLVRCGEQTLMTVNASYCRFYSFSGGLRGHTRLSEGFHTRKVPRSDHFHLFRSVSKHQKHLVIDSLVGSTVTLMRFPNECLGGWIHGRFIYIVEKQCIKVLDFEGHLLKKLIHPAYVFSGTISFWFTSSHLYVGNDGSILMFQI